MASLDNKPATLAQAEADAAATEPLEVVDTPTSPSSGLALSRFEFEMGKANEGTKVLMVEWDGSVGAASGGEERRTNAIDWDVSWEGKATVLQVRDTDPEVVGSNTRRAYFLLPPAAAVPALISITRKAGEKPGAAAATALHTKPMPAIFLAGLGGGEGAGRRGVLHTIWARKRLAELEVEIESEMKENGESVGLEMALQERQWIVDHFGLGPEQGAPNKTSKLHIPQTPISPTSPRSPIGGRLGEKLRGLKLATSPADLAAATQATKPRLQPLSTNEPSAPPLTRLSKDSGNAGLASLDAVIGTKLPAPSSQRRDENTEEELFALPMSPRSPEMKRSPFSLL
ncbi:hypothetical protein B0H67DRAFT_596660 [Lasiosphaeris hirsuta]|uniref:Uncharacterized protein n=1 Tax=Lasiosphaeris hirsuta TaxID=260670 RepID=A0AA40E9Z4_9PEZI|nr:hypothetical protein B0H67DRAFT_596660 [Lasiosphaeris hirsuta]